MSGRKMENGKWKIEKKKKKEERSRNTNNWKTKEHKRERQIECGRSNSRRNNRESLSGK